MALFGLTSPAPAQSIRQVSLNTSTDEIDRRYLPYEQTFDFLIRAASELRELHGHYRTASDSGTVLLDPWIRREGTKSKDATLRVDSLSPGQTYQFTFVLIRRPSGNEGRLIEARVLDALREAFRMKPDEPLDEVAKLAAPGVKAALEGVLPRAVPATGSPLTGDPAALSSALETRGIDVLHKDYRHQLVLVDSLRSELQRERGSLARAAALARVLNTIESTLDQRGDFAELRAPLDACRQAQDSSEFTGPASIPAELEQLGLLTSLKQLDAALGSCRGLLRDVRLPRYSHLFAPQFTRRPGRAAQVADLLLPVENRLDALRSATERLVSLWRKREGTLGPVATDLRRTLDTCVTLSDTLTASFDTGSKPVDPPTTTLGITLAGTYAPCSLTNSCLRIVPALTLSIRLKGPLGAEAGFTLAETEAPGRTRHLFWFTSAMTGLTVRLGGSQRLGAGALILRRAEGSDFDSFQLGGYVSFTLFDFRL